jgi:hypothetical protein
MKKFTLILSFALLLGSAVSAQIAFRSSSTATTDNTSLTIAKPAGLVAGDLMIAVINQADNDDATLANASLSGWTVISGLKYGEGTGSDDEWWGTVLYRIATAGDVSATDFTFTLDSDADDGVGGIIAYSGVDNVTPFDVASGTLSTANSDDLAAAAKTTVTANAAVVMVGLVGDNRTYSGWSTTSPGSLTEVMEDDLNSSNLDMSVGAAWALKATAGNTGAGAAELSANESDFNASMLLVLRPGAVVPPTPASLWATSSSGTQISAFAVSNGTYISGPTNLFAATFPGTTTGGTSTAALGRTDQPTAANGHFYYLPNTGGDGIVEVYAATANGSTIARVGSLDVNGGGNDTDLGFVRLGMGPDGTGWILAGDGTTLYLAKFTANGTGAVTITVEDASVTLAGGTVGTFQNGDVAISGNGTLYALANSGSVTQIFIGSPNGSSTTLTKRWDLVDPSNVPFNTSVNGVAFDAQGSLYVSTGNGLYYIDDNTVNGPAGTVQCALVFAVTGLQDLASNVFPTETTLPVKLNSFTGSLHNNIATLNWDASSETNFSHYEIERSSNGSNFATVGSKNPAGGNGRNAYQFADNLAAVSGNVFYYRLKIVDIDGHTEYSSVIMVRKDQESLTGLTVNPNPVVGGIALVRFSSTSNGLASIRVIDMTGKVVLQQQDKVNEGVNSVPVRNASTLQKGTYILQVQNGEELTATKFSVVR